MHITNSQLVRNERQFSVNEQENKWTERLYAYHTLINDSFLNLGTPDDTTFQNFYDTVSLNNTGSIVSILEKILDGDYAAALLQNTTFTPHNLQDENYKTVHEIFLQAWIDSLQKLNLDTIQRMTLELVACQEPMLGGEAVFSARVMLQNWTGCGSQKMANGTKNNEFNEPSIYNSEDFENAKALNNDGKTVITKLYPNPNDGNMFLDYILTDGIDGMLTIYDITGGEIMKQQISSGQNKIAINKAALMNGIYFYEIKINNATKLREKLIIIK